jgi:hypothetical protein
MRHANRADILKIGYAHGKWYLAETISIEGKRGSQNGSFYYTLIDSEKSFPVFLHVIIISTVIIIYQPHF